VSENCVSSTERSPAKHRRPYSVAEIFVDGVVHTAALIAGAAGFALLFALAPVQGGAPEYAALIVYAVCFFLMFGFSFAYNMVPDSAVKRWLRRCDHSGIYLMIAGTYTALMALVQAEWWTVALVVFVWCGAVVGVASKLFMPTRLDRGAVGFYLALSWSAIVAIKPLAATLPATALALIVAGGLIYSAGVPFYVWRSLKFQNAIWHACVALGAALQFGGVVAAIGAPS
jgi:hemolysin III